MNMYVKTTKIWALDLQKDVVGKNFRFFRPRLRIREKSAEEKYKPLYFLFYAFCTFFNSFIVPNCLCPLTK